MDKNERQKAIEEQKRKYYKQYTNEIRLLHECFKESGFTDDQAFELTSTYVRQTMFDNVLRSNIHTKEYRSTTKEMIERLKKYKGEDNAGKNE